MPIKIIVIGGGPGGYVAALRAAALGGDVTLIEKENLGGTCLNWGCIPSKIMKNTADIFLKFLKADNFGIKVQGSVSPDMTTLMEKKDKILESQRQGIAVLLKNRGVVLQMGRAVIKSKEIVKVISKDDDSKELDYDKLIIATGTKPLNVADFPFDHHHILSSNDILQLDAVPESLVIVGGGVIGCEFACIFSALGAKVTIVEALSRLLPLPAVDEDCSKLLLREMKKRKITVFCDTIVESSDIKKDLVSIHLELSPFTDNPKPKKLKTNVIEAQKMAVCIGRSALSSDLGLENIGLKTTPQGWIDANEKLETSVQGVYAIGDILGPEKVMLAHVASHEGIIAAQNAMGDEGIMDYDVIPGAIFTMPEIGTVGLSEVEAKKKGYDVEAFSVNFRSLGKAQAIDELAGIAKMIVEKESKKVLGVHMIGAHATDLIAEATLAIQKGLSAADIAHTIHAHPTLAEIMGEVSLKACGKPIHG
ncbi:MAG: dihydrolipoyl dehydrogenase [Deltaproteobacteria bacterium]|uniref:dihydrolipoyl dehydrogenase n=1 Tax=Desulfobacula sp. TaxID=2593537 RepID=UPI00198D77EA|nr:dihydrolipoyl dehydrogenase [Candidatus Desulfobacula maris]MBL6994318.1 dihydrolipoyl dehydrogenase [Desulfobacula sp.]